VSPEARPVCSLVCVSHNAPSLNRRKETAINAMRPVIISNKANNEGTTLREAAFATGYVNAADFDRIVNPAVIAGTL
jgi:fumarate hydratase class II